MNTERLTQVISEIVERWEIPGLAVGVVQAGEIIYTQCFGVQSVETQVPITPQTSFCVASISKVFVATAIMQLVERGELHLEDPLVKYLPYFRLDDARGAQITLRQVLSHTSGMPDLSDFEYDHLWKHPEFDEGAPECYVRSLAQRKMVSHPGEEFHYSNIGYNVLGDLISKVSGVSFETYLKDQVLLPAGMKESTFLPGEVPEHLLAFPHLHVPEVIPSPFYPYHRADAPASALHASLEGMCAWIRLCLGSGRLGERQILRQETFEIMTTPVVRRGYPPFYEDMSLSWNIGHYQCQKTISHGGFGAGWADTLLISPEGGWGLVVLSIDESYLQVRQALLDALFGLEPQAGSVSWAVPVSQALIQGGLPAAQARAEQILKTNLQDYWVDEDLLITLALHLMIMEKLNLAIGILEINRLAFPDCSQNFYYLANAYLQQGETSKAKESLLKALSLNPDDREAALLLKEMSKRSSKKDELSQHNEV
jgi:CubicO group peptidase (beta-lactamase class C family)